MNRTMSMYFLPWLSSPVYPSPMKTPLPGMSAGVVSQLTPAPVGPVWEDSGTGPLSFSMSVGLNGGLTMFTGLSSSDTAGS